MSRPRNHSRKWVSPLALILAIVFAGTLLVASLVTMQAQFYFAREWKPQARITVPGQGTFEYGWIPQYELIPNAWGRSYDTYLVWVRPDETRRFRIMEGGDPLGRNIRIYGAKGGQGLWLVDADFGSIRAALEFDSGRFWDVNQLPGFNTEPHSMAIQQWPSWAVRPGSKQLYPAATVPAPSR